MEPDSRRRSQRSRKSQSFVDYDDDFQPTKKKKRSNQDIVNLYKSCARTAPTDSSNIHLDKSSAEICKELDIVDVEMEYTEEDFEKLATYTAFSQNMRRHLTKANPKSPISNLLLLINSKWRKFSAILKQRNGESNTQSQSIEDVEKESNVETTLEGDGETTRKDSTSEKDPSDDESYSEKKVEKKTSSVRTSRRNKEDEEFKDTYNTSDEEFERQLEEVNSIEANESSATSSYKSKKQFKKSVKKTIVPMSEHEESCTVCHQSGELILCDTCPKSYHFICLNSALESAPVGSWICPQCEKIKVTPPVSHIDEIVHRNHCNMCKLKENLIECDRCTRSYHAYCLNPILEQNPECNWTCPCCLVTGLERKVHKVVCWRFVEDVKVPEKFANVKHRHPFREFFVKWKGKSYMQCEWITDFEYDGLSPTGYRTYCRLNDMEEPPLTDEIRESANSDEKSDESLSIGDYVEKNYVRFGIRIEWVTIHRVLNHQKYPEDDFTWYYVKWRELPYNYCTWESDQDELLEFQRCIDDYWSLRELMLTQQPKQKKKSRGKHKRSRNKKPVTDIATIEDSPGIYKKIPSNPTTDLKKKLEQQQSFFGGTLHDYQLEGLNWLRYSWYHDTNTILADEMGLGKTIQTVAFLYSLYKEGHSTGPFLIAAPLSTVVNWEREIEFWAPEFYTVTYSGDKEGRQILREYELSFDEGIIRGGSRPSKVRSQNLKFHVMLTSFEMISIDQATLGSINWKVLVVDEAHRLKNNQSRFFKIISGYNIDYKLLLTGTPLQNNLEELFHLLNFLEPNDFYDCAGFLDNFKDIAKEDQIKKLHDMLGPHLLRRLKADVLKSMPSKHELIVRIDLSPLQKKYYRFILTKNYEALSGKTSNHVSLLNVMMDLKKCCNHPFLFPSAAADAPRLPSGAYAQEALVKSCNKMILIDKMLIKLKATNHRVLIFSQMTKVLDLLEDFLENAAYKYERIDGSITGSLRQDAIDRFNAPGSDRFVFLLSTRAGGLGINLASADTVFIYDSDWNPHNDIQAFSRAHRIGQVNQVLIYRFVTRNSVEERITEVAKRKMMLTHLVVRPGMGGSKGSTVTKKELDDILKFGTEDLFKEDQKGDNEKNIVYDNAEIDQLLLRNRDLENEDGEETMNHYLSSFKVAQYKTTDRDESDKTGMDVVSSEVTAEEKDKNDANYWDKLLKHHYEQEMEDQHKALGKGKRIRKQVNYNDQTTITVSKKELLTNPTWSPQMSDVDSTYSGAEPDDGDFENIDPSMSSNKSKRFGKFSEKDRKIPPLLCQVNNQLEVFGFNARQRKSFSNAIMRYGLPPKDEFCAHWLVRDLRGKSTEVLKAYTQMYMRHLCETSPVNVEHFSDGVPRENLNRHIVLTRIGIMTLIRKKVEEFESINGKYFIPNVVLVNDRLVINKYRMRSTIMTKTMDETSERPVIEIDEEMLKMKKFCFNITDASFTELHTLWGNEERVIREEGKLIWNKYHDYWLLRGIVAHGYGRWYDMQTDPKLAIINQPFEDEGRDQNAEYKNKFLSRRFKLLEQALVVEEQLRKAAFLKYNQALEHPVYDLSYKFSKLESLADTNHFLAQQAVSGNKAANIVLHRILNQLEDLLSDMKLDLSRIPAALARLDPVSDRLEVSELGIIEKLSNGIKYVSSQNMTSTVVSTADSNDVAKEESEISTTPMVLEVAPIVSEITTIQTIPDSSVASTQVETQPTVSHVDIESIIDTTELVKKIEQVEAANPEPLQLEATQESHS